jgi:hypothetical protein
VVQVKTLALLYRAARFKQLVLRLLSAVAKVKTISAVVSDGKV